MDPRTIHRFTQSKKVMGRRDSFRFNKYICRSFADVLLRCSQGTGGVGGVRKADPGCVLVYRSSPVLLAGIQVWIWPEGAVDRPFIFSIYYWHFYES